MKSLSKDSLEEILAYEYGYLDAKYKIDYDPRPFGLEKQYANGFKSMIVFKNTSIPVGSYIDKTNWGWY